MVKDENHIERQLGVWLIILNKGSWLKPKWAVKLYGVLRKAAMHPVAFVLLRDTEDTEECELLPVWLNVFVSYARRSWMCKRSQG